MINSYLENLKQTYFEEQLALEKKQNDLNILLQENMEFRKLLEDNNDFHYESFTPRDVNSKDKQKIAELKEEKKKIESDLEKIAVQYKICKNKIEELDTVIEEEKNREICQKNNLLERKSNSELLEPLKEVLHQTELCCKLIDIDSIRCRLELSSVLQKLSVIISEIEKPEL